MMQIPEWSPIEVDAYLKGHPEAKLVDVRTDEEFATARIAGSVLINTLEKAAEVLALPKDTPLIFQCHHGMRSLQAALWFREKGFAQTINLTGGIDAWSLAVDPSVPRY